MIDFNKFRYILMITALLFIACAADRVDWRDDEATVVEQDGIITDTLETSDTSSGFAPIQQEEIHPFRPKAPGFYVQPSKLNARPRLLKSLRPSTETAFSQQGEDIGGAMQTVSGYRVQIVAVSDQASAHRIEENMRERYGEIVYLIYEAPRYKVRIGNFTSRDEAVQFCRQLMQEGYPDAWVVRSQVTIHR